MVGLWHQNIILLETTILKSLVIADPTVRVFNLSLSINWKTGNIVYQ